MPRTYCCCPCGVLQGEDTWRCSGRLRFLCFSGPSTGSQRSEFTGKAGDLQAVRRSKHQVNKVWQGRPETVDTDARRGSLLFRVFSGLNSFRQERGEDQRFFLRLIS